MSNESTIRLLVWDDPDMRASLASVLVSSPPSEAVADLESVFLWLEERCRYGEEAQACLFTVIEPGNEAQAAQHITDIRNQGFAVVVRPATGASSAPLTPSLRAYVDRAMADGSVAELVVASHDADGLRVHLDELAGRGVKVSLLGFREKAQFAAESSLIDFIDVESVSGAFAFPLPRTNLYDLPLDGVALPPLRKPTRGGAKPAPPTPVKPAPAPTPESTAAASWAPASTSDVVYPAPSYSPAPSSTDYTPASTLSDYAPAEGTSGYYTPADAHSVEGGSIGEQDESAESSEPAPSHLTSGLFGGSSADLQSRPASGLLGDEVPPPPPPPSPSSLGALNDLLAGVQATPLAGQPEPPPPPARPGRVSPPNGLSE